MGVTMTAKAEKRVCISFKIDSEEFLHQIAAFTKYKKSEIVDASVRHLFETLGIHDGMTIAEVKNTLQSFFNN